MAGLNREGWLTEMAGKLVPLFRGYTHLRPEVFRVTCGWPVRGALSRKSPRIGECHGARSSTGGLFEIFVSPLIADPVEVGGTLAHELAHVAAGIDAGHGARFKKVCQFVGLTKGKATSAGPGPELSDRIRRITDDLGDYPHAAMAPAGKEKKKGLGPAVLECRTCGCRVTIGRKWLEEVGPPPSCGCGGKFGDRGQGDG